MQGKQIAEKIERCVKDILIKIDGKSKKERDKIIKNICSKYKCDYRWIRRII